VEREESVRAQRGGICKYVEKDSIHASVPLPSHPSRFSGSTSTREETDEDTHTSASAFFCVRNLGNERKGTWSRDVDDYRRLFRQCHSHGKRRACEWHLLL